jgi:UDP-3-O-[3-hydroxymyristoyl] glucosamine N-acyltransferase
MSGPVFFERGAGLTIEDIIKLSGATPRGAVTPGLRIHDVAAIDRAGPDDLTFAEDRDQQALTVSQAGACFVRDDLVSSVAPSVLALAVGDPYRAFVLVASALYPQALRPSSLFATKGAAASALIHPQARLEAGVTIDPAAMVGPHAEIGAGTLIGPMAVIGPGVRVGRDCVVGPGASLTNVLIGDRVVIHAGCRIGGGFNVRSLSGRFGAAPQLGRVIIQDKVEIGANCTVDRGICRDTVIGEGSRVDSLIHIAADVMVGRLCEIVSTGSSHEILSPDDANFGPPTFDDGIRIAASAVGRMSAAVQTGRISQ